MNENQEGNWQWLERYSRGFSTTGDLARYANTLTLLLPWEFAPAKADAGYVRLWAAILKGHDHDPV